MAKLEIIEATNQSIENNKIKIFLAGGITNCPDWQKIIIDKIKHTSNPYQKTSLKNVTIFNPRRENFPIEDPRVVFSNLNDMKQEKFGDYMFRLNRKRKLEKLNKLNGIKNY